MTYAMPFQKYVKTVLRVATPRSTRCITHIVVKQRADEGIGPYDFAWLCILRQPEIPAHILTAGSELRKNGITSIY